MSSWRRAGGKGLNNLCELMDVCQLLTDARSRVGGLRAVQFVSPVMVLVCRTWPIKLAGCQESP